jgi:DDE_Tnp_1-associated
MNLIEAIKAVPDYRHPRGIRHELWLILTIVLLGSCTGYWGYKPLASFTKNHRLRLLELLDLPPETRFPSASTFRNIMMAMDFQIMANLFNVWAEQGLSILLSTVTELAESSVAIDTNLQAERLHGRSTTREVKVYPIPPDLLLDWVGVKSLIEVDRSGTRPQGKKSRRQIVDDHERHFYLSSLTYSAAEFADAIRGHW